MTHNPLPDEGQQEQADMATAPVAQHASIFSRPSQVAIDTLVTPSPAPNLDAVASAFAQQRQEGSQALEEQNKAAAGPSRMGVVENCAPLQLSTRIRKKPTRLTLPSKPRRPSDTDGSETGPGSRSVPSSPLSTKHAKYAQQADEAEDGREQLRDTLRGAPRRRPSVPFGLRIAAPPLLFIPTQTAAGHARKRSTGKGPPPIWQDPSEHILSGHGSSLQHARSVYASGPVEVLPGLFLGDEFNARDDACLAQRGITTILNVAKETTLPFQVDASNESLDFLGPASLTQGLQRSLRIADTAATPTSSTHAREIGMQSPPRTAARETFYTPVTSMPPVSAMLSHPPPTPSPLPSTGQGTLYLRNTSSTPNLHLQFSTLRTDADDEEDDGATSSISSQRSNHTPNTTPPSPTSALPSLDHHGSVQGLNYSPAYLSATTPSSNSGHSSRSIATTTSASSSSSAGSYSIALPHNAIALQVQPSPATGRGESIRYIKLPWTHDETELAGLAAGGFITGCSIIADALGIDLVTGKGGGGGRGGVLVHCQCGVSRSATLVIAFVMQAAALNYQFKETQRLTGMHDCYEMVKELSASISPNCSLIYQLVEWERYLSRQVANAAHSSRQTNDAAGGAAAAEEKKRWGNEAMNEEDWTRMRLDEERKEREEEEEEQSRQARLETAKGQQQVAPLSQPATLSIVGATTGLGARRKRTTPSLTLASSAKSLADQVAKQQRPTTTAVQEEDGGEEEAMAVDTVAALPLSDVSLQPQPLPPPPRGFLFSPALTTSSSSSSSVASTAGPVEAPMHPSGFGARRQSAAERRNKHKRTFSSELPDWNRRLSVTMTAGQGGETPSDAAL